MSMRVHDAGVGQNGQQCVQTENVKRALQEPPLASALVLQNSKLISVEPVTCYAISVAKPRPIAGYIDNERKNLGFEGGEQEVKAFRGIIRGECMLAPHLGYQPIQYAVRSDCAIS